MGIRPEARPRVGLETVGVIHAEGPPVPIPNTEVKLCRAEDTQLETARENRYMPTRTEVRLCKSNLCLLNIPP